VPAFAEQQIGELAAQRAVRARKIAEERGVARKIGARRGRHIRHNRAQESARREHAVAFAQKRAEFFGVKMLENVRRINRGHRTRRKWQAVAQIEPHVALAQNVSIDIHETGEIFRSAAQMQVQRAGTIGAQAANLPVPIIQLVDAPQSGEINVTRSLMKHICSLVC